MRGSRYSRRAPGDLCSGVITQWYALLSGMLTSAGVHHEVLNAKHHERESEIIKSAGQLGAVMVATNMAGRGTDIRLGEFEPAELLDHWKRRGIVPREIDPDQPDEEIIAAVYRHIAPKELDKKKGDVEAMSDDDVRQSLLRRWAYDQTFLSEDKIDAMSDDALREALDKTGSSLLHRLRPFTNVEDLGGLHVLGTERHESRRIDNQLRGRITYQPKYGAFDH